MRIIRSIPPDDQTAGTCTFTPGAKIEDLSPANKDSARTLQERRLKRQDRTRRVLAWAEGGTHASVEVFPKVQPPSILVHA